MGLIEIAISDEQILATRDVMRQLRPHLASEEYLPMVKRMMQSEGYRLVALYERDAYVDDLNTDERQRSRGHGKALLDWLKAEAEANGCVQLDLDSGVQREAAHRFYFRERLTINAHHFRVAI